MIECSSGMSLIADDKTFTPNIITNLERPGNVRVHERVGHARSAGVAQLQLPVCGDPLNSKPWTDSMEEKLTFLSDGLKLSAVLHVPEGRKPGQRLPAFIVLHGFVGSKDEVARRDPGAHVGAVRLRGTALRLPLLR